MDLYSISSGRANAWPPEAIWSTSWSLKSRLALPAPFLPCWASFSWGGTGEERRWRDCLGTSVSKWPLTMVWERIWEAGSAHSLLTSPAACAQAESPF